MKLLRRRTCKRIISITISFTVLALSISSFSSVNPSSTEYAYLTASGSSMYPAIRDGDRVTIELCVDGSLVNVWDIIVYSTIATGMNPGYMWIGHRVIEKYSKSHIWFFKTKGDNCSEADPWEVPEYWLLGKTVNVGHVERAYVPPGTPSHREHAQATYSNTSFPEGSQALLMIVGSLCLGVIMAVFDNLKRGKQMTVLKKANIYSCYSCRHYQIYYPYKVEPIYGRIGMHKMSDFSKGFCRYYNLIIENFPRRNCQQYEPKTYT